MSTILSYPFLTSLEKGLSPYNFSMFSLFRELLFDSSLSRYACMIGTRNPESRVSTHAVISDHDVFDGEHQRMSDMELTGDIWRWEGYIEFFPISRICREKTLPFFPELLDSTLGCLRCILFWEFGHRG